MRDIIIIGGGLAGLINAIQLSRSGLDVLLVERKRFPFHKVCGEYISNEVIPFLKEINCFPEAYEPANIVNFQLSSVSGKLFNSPLDLGGFGISRYTLDHYLYRKALDAGVSICLESHVEDLLFAEDQFKVDIRGGRKEYAKIVIGAFGKRSTLDNKLDRAFIKRKSPYIGVKYHIKTDFPNDLIALHNFKGGYCGISKVENAQDNRFNLCYLSHRHNLKTWGNIAEMEKQVLCQNPYLKNIWENADFIFSKPFVINEISFERKSAVENHILMSGDAAGMITPLCGNGMAMAIHSAKILSSLIIDHYKNGKLERERLEKKYTHIWEKRFSQRLWVGRNTQKLFGGIKASEIALSAAKLFPPMASFIMKKTHGVPF